MSTLDFNLLTGRTVSHTVLQAFEAILKKGVDVDTRNGAARSIFNAFMITENPRYRHLAIAGRHSNIFQMIAETLWVLSGSGKVTGFLEYFLPRALNYSDDGENWRGAYGPRITGHTGFNQLDSVVDIFRQDGLKTRRAIVSIYNPSLDSQAALKSVYGLDNTKDLPCNLLLNFYTDALGRFCLKLVQRSGDCLFGAGSINPFEFTLIQELVYSRVRQMYPGLELGPFVHDVTNLHIYDQFKSQAQVAVNTPQVIWQVEDAVSQDSYLRCSFDELAYHLNVFVEGCEQYIQDPTPERLREMEARFAEAAVIVCQGHKVSGNMLVEYMWITMRYLVAKNGGETSLTLGINTQKDLILAITTSKFNPFSEVKIHDGVE